MNNNINCPYCNINISLNTLNKHLCSKHLDKYNEQVNLIKSLFFDYNFSKQTIQDYPQVILNINTIYNIWKQTYTNLERKLRMKKCNALHQSKCVKKQFKNIQERLKQNIINNNCLICGGIKEKQLISHIKNYHKDIYEKLIANIKELFYDRNFVRQNYYQYKNKLFNISYSIIYNIWKKYLGKQLVSNRQKILRILC